MLLLAGTKQRAANIVAQGYFEFLQQLEFILLSIGLQTTLLKEDMTPYGALQPQPPLSDSSLTRSFSFIIYLVGATYRRWDILRIFKQFTTHELKRCNLKTTTSECLKM